MGLRLRHRAAGQGLGYAFSAQMRSRFCRRPRRSRILSCRDLEYRRDEYGTLEHLLDVCQDAALGARLAAEIFNGDADLVSFFNDVAAERDAFCTQLAILLPREGYASKGDHTGTFRGRLFHWRMQLAKRMRVGYRDIDDFRVNMHIIARGHDHILHAYKMAEAGQLGAEVREEVHRQAERVRATNIEIHRLAAL